MSWCRRECRDFWDAAGAAVSDEFGRRHFLAWTRQGIASLLKNPDYGSSLPDRGSLQVALSVVAHGPDSTTPVPPVSVQTFGPGDVLGFDPGHVVRTEPRDSTTNFEPNYLAGVEFDRPDFPWLFTPAAPAGDRLRPWIALVVLIESEYTPVPGVVQPLPAIDVTRVAGLQPLDDSWNWAHAQVSGDAGLVATEASTPTAVISRLLCPRRLDPETAYTAFVVPAFETGRMAGLGLDVSGLHSSDPAWTSTTGAPLRLPVYYRFRFHTSDQGDFESLVRRLVPRKLGANIGQRLIAVDQVMPGVPGAGPPLGMDGALCSIAVKETQWLDPPKTQFQTGVALLINRTSPLIDNPADPDPEVVPPIYGRWPAGVRVVTPGATGWLDDLSLDPRNRATAGTGTQVVQQLRTSLMASAWQQVAGIEAANDALRRAQLARGALTALHSGLAAAADTSVLMLTAPLHAKLLASPITVRATIDASRVPERLLSPAARRLTHPGGLIRRRQLVLAGTAGRATAEAARGVSGSTSLLERVNAGALGVVPPPSPPGGLVAVEDVGGGGVAPPWRKWFPLVLHADSTAGSFDVTIDVDTGPSPPQTNPATVSAVVIDATPPRPEFVLTSPGERSGAEAPEGEDSAVASRFRQALSSMAEAWAAATPDPPLAPALDVAALRSTIAERLQPATTVAARMRAIVSVAARLNWNSPDPIHEIMAAPSFPQAMYAPLRDLSEQYILPGADQIPADTVGLLEANHAFIEAYMVGLSHEMARQLLFAGYPTDCMGTYFRQFWDVSKYVPEAGDPTDPAQLAELLKDIPPIVTWPLDAGLGQHENRADIVPNNVVLIIRGELLRRYPDAIIYAARAKIVQGQRVIDETAEKYPIFGGSLSADTNFLGFNLGAADVKGGTASSPEGWFFVFQQHPTGPRFGLEPSAAETVARWADLAWTNFGGAAPAAPAADPVKLVGPWTTARLASSTFAAVLADRPIPDFLSASLSPTGVTVSGDDAANTWGQDAAQTAYITARLPFRVAIHGDLMVPDQ
jgi:hypothetical protein